jgi:hypothetical protein
MAYDVQSIRYDAPPTPGFFDYAAQFLQSYQDKKEEKQKEDRSTLLALLPALAAQGQVEPGGDILGNVIPGGLKIGQKKTNWSDYNSMLSAMDKLGMLPDNPTDWQYLQKAYDMMSFNPDYMTASPEDQAKMLSQQKDVLKKTFSGRGQGSDVDVEVEITAKDGSIKRKIVPQSVLDTLPEGSYRRVGQEENVAAAAPAQTGPSAALPLGLAATFFGAKALSKAAPALKAGAKAASSGLSLLKTPMGGALGKGFTMSPPWNAAGVTPLGALGAGMVGATAGDFLARAPLFGGRSIQEATYGGELPSSLQDKNVLQQLAVLANSYGMGQYKR